MKKAIIPILSALVLSLLTGLVVAADGFYTTALEEGQALFSQGDYKQALERLEFAAFGLLNRPELMRKVRAYSALALFQLSRFDEARAGLEGIESDPRAIDLKAAGIDDADTELFHIMIRALYPGKKNETGTGTLRAFELTFLDAYKAAREENWTQVDAGISRLAGLIPDDPRIALLRGMGHIGRGRFGDAFRVLKAVRESIQPEFRDRLLFSLVLAGERVEEYGEARRAYDEIRDERLRRSLEPVIHAVNKRRERDIETLARNYERGLMRRLVERFPKDDTLALEIWKAAVEVKRMPKDSRERMALELAAFETATNRQYFLLAAAWLEQVERTPQALKLLEKSRYARVYSVENVELLYMIGRLQGKLGKADRARDLMRRILVLHPSHAAAKNYLDRFQNAKSK